MRTAILVLLVALVFLSSCSPSQPEMEAAATAAESAVTFFQSIPEQHFLVGQMGAYGDGWTPELVSSTMTRFHERTGQYPAIIGMDYWRKDKTLEVSIQEANTILIDWHRRGAYTTITTHFQNPFTEGGGVTDRTGNDRLTELLDPATPVGRRWRGWLDTIAAGLQGLEDAGVRVLWRPLHEMNGAWFWWGAAENPDDFKRLWQEMYTYLETTKALSNLIWVYSPNVGQNVTLYYPGAEYVDVVGLDKYMTLEETSGQEPLTLEGYNLLTTLEKPIYLSEFGPRPSDASGQEIPFDYLRLLEDITTQYPKLFAVLHWEWIWALPNDVDVNQRAYMEACQTLSLNEAPNGCRA
jgi:mannan endo-1,4-beta-mannosidase